MQNTEKKKKMKMKVIKNSETVIFSVYIPIAVNAMEWRENIAFNEGMPRKAGNSEIEQSGTVTAVKQCHTVPPTRLQKDNQSFFIIIQIHKKIFSTNYPKTPKIH